MKRTIFEIFTATTLGVIAFYLYSSFLGVVASYTYQAFKYIKYVPQNMRKMVFWTSVLIHDAIVSIPVFLVIGAFLGFALKKYHWNRPIILFISFVLAEIVYLFVIVNIGFPSSLYIEVIRFTPSFIMILLFTKIGYKVKLNRLKYT